MAKSFPANPNVNINNLNITTFIKDIYLSLKHIDTCFSTFKNDIDAKMIKLEGQYETILERLAQIETTINQVRDRASDASNIDSAIEKELLDKMYKLASATEESNRLELKPKELTIANILENGYTMLDINNSLEATTDSYSKFEYKPIDLSDMNNMYNMCEISEISDISNMEKTQTLDSLLFN
jgi:hypothetical protein